MKISLASYTIKVFDKENKQYIKLDKLIEIGSKYYSLENLFEEFIKFGRTNGYNNKQLSKVFRVLDDEKIYSNNRDFLCGTIESGDYGYESKIVKVNDTENSNNINENFEEEYDESQVIGIEVIKKGKDQAELIPFFYMIGFLNDSRRAVLFIERVNYLGIKMIVEREINKFFKKKIKKMNLYNEYKKYTIEIINLMPKEVVDKLLEQGRLTELRFIKYNAPKEIVDKLEKKIDDKDIHSELIIKGKNIPMKKGIKSIMQRGKKVTDLVEIKNFEYQNLKVEITIGKDTKKIIDMSDFMKINSYFDITSDVEIDDKTGHAKYGSIKAIFTKTMVEMVSELEGEINE